MLWTFHCFDPHAGAALKGDQVVTAGHTISAKEVRWVDVPRMFPQALLQINHWCSGCVQCPGCSGLAYCCEMLLSAKVAMLDLADIKYSPWISVQKVCCKLQIFSVLLNLSSPFLVALLTCSCEIKVYELNRPGTVVSTTDFFQWSCLYNWTFDGYHCTFSHEVQYNDCDI